MPLGTGDNARVDEAKGQVTIERREARLRCPAL